MPMYELVLCNLVRNLSTELLDLDNETINSKNLKKISNKITAKLAVACNITDILLAKGWVPSIICGTLIFSSERQFSDQVAVSTYLKDIGLDPSHLRIDRLG